MICFFVFLVLNGLMLLLDIPKWKRLVWTKLLVFSVSSAGMLALAVTKAGGSVGYARRPLLSVIPSRIADAVYPGYRSQTRRHEEQYDPRLDSLLAPRSDDPHVRRVVLNFRSVLLIPTRYVSRLTFAPSPTASNASDWQRNATKPNDPILGALTTTFPVSYLPGRAFLLTAHPSTGQLIGFPLSNFIVQVIGMLVASTSEVVYGEVVWNPVIYLERLLVDNFDAAHRAGAFFISAGFVYSLLFSVSNRDRCS
jgi:NCS1 family nucleobase:cation symporter-1